MLNIFPQTLCSGDVYPLKLTFKDKATGAPYDLTGTTVGGTVKSIAEDSDDTTAAWMADVVGDTTGIIQFYIAKGSPLVAGDYWLDIKMWSSNGSGPTRTTVIPPIQMHIIQSVTTR